MKAFIIAAILPNEWEQEKVIEAVNRGIKLVATDNNFDNTKAFIWHAKIVDKFNLERQDI